MAVAMTVGLVAAVATWLLDSVVDYLTAPQGLTFFEMIVSPPLHAVFARSMLAVVLLSFSWAAGRVIGMLHSRQARIGHLNSVLRSIREINRLIVSERDTERLLQEACELLVRGRGFSTAWVALLGEDGTVTRVFSHGLGEEREAFHEQLRGREIACCALGVAADGGGVITDDAAVGHARWAAENAYQTETVTVAPIRSQEEMIGYLGVTLPPEAAEDDEERELLGEIADDLAAGLDAIETQMELRGSEERFRLLFDRSGDSIFIHEMDGPFLEVNETACQRYGYSREQILQMTPRDFATPESIPVLEDRIIAIAEKGKAFFETVHLDSAGNRIPVEINVRVMEYEGAECFLSIVRDISDRKQAEEEIRRLSRFRQAIIDQANTAVVVFSQDGHAVVWNRAMEEITGYPADYVMGMNRWEELLGDPQRVQQVREMIAGVLREGAGITDVEIALRAADGTERLISWYGRRLEGEDGEVLGAVAMGRDVTEQRELERRLDRSQRMEAIGRLAGAIAHDFNNMLTTIIGNARLLERELVDETALARLSDITTASERSADLTRQLLTFSRSSRTEPSVFDLNSVVVELQSMLDRLTREHTTVAVELAPEGAPVRADRSQMEQVVMNLLVNARDAMPEGGLITVETERAQVSEARASAMAHLKPGRHVVLRVSDTGCGMDEATLAKAFEPFFTTKEEGTGLGLATVYGVVQECEGDIDLISAPGEGTTVTVYLPEADEAPAQDAEVGRSECGANGADGRTRVLLAEDEEQVRGLVASILESGGYEVLAAESGEEALELLARTDEQIDLLLTDVVMPGMDGRELAGRLRKRPGAPRVLFISGYRHLELAEGEHLLEKPFTPDELLAAVHEALMVRG